MMYSKGKNLCSVLLSEMLPKKVTGFVRRVYK